MGPEKPLPYDTSSFGSVDEYVDSLLNFVGTNELLRTLCGGVHVLDFFTTQNPDLYSRTLPESWRNFFTQHEITTALDLLMREDLEQFDTTAGHGHNISQAESNRWREGPAPPRGLLNYIRHVRKHLLLRQPADLQWIRNREVEPTRKLAKHVAVGMTVKKVHEVGLFARYITNLASLLPESAGPRISHLVDFGSGQNYLGRALASEPYNKSIVAIESKSHNAERAKEYDVMAKLATKQKVMRNKKAFRAGLEGPDVPTAPPTSPPKASDSNTTSRQDHDASLDPEIEASTEAKGKIQYVEHRIEDGDLTDVIRHINEPEPRLMVMSLHSCGNLVHHGLRSLTLNPAVKAVAMVGCCYNLVTERLGPATYKLPGLKPPSNLRTSSEEEIRRSTTRQQSGRNDWSVGAEHSFRWEKGDPHGFPMSNRLCADGPNQQGIKLNITARMMAVQAPQNWGPRDSESFFTRHFYRALLQRIFLDKGVIGPPHSDCAGGSPAGHSSGAPIIVGSLRKSCYENFVAYVRGALGKLYEDSSMGDVFRTKLSPEKLSDDEIAQYEQSFRHNKKDLSIIWSLMAFSAGAIEAAIVVDRWLWLKEQDVVKDAWVEAVFGYGISPRNLVVVGIKE